MLSKKEREGSARFLQEFPKHELLSLVETVTNRMITVRNKQEAINAIILHSDSALELLRRKKVKKEYIFRHLATLTVGVSSTSDKATLVRQLLSLWGTNVSQQCVSERMEVDDLSDDPGPDRNPTLKAPSASEPPKHVQVLAEQFTSWFYSQLNSLSQVIASNSPSDWGSHHFWEDCKLNLRLIISEVRDESFYGAECVAQRFRNFVCEEGLIFNPNLSPEGTRGFVDPHGLVMVRVCGTVHRYNDCLGLFEQQFGLIRDPLKENNWKIKFIDMSMKQTAVQRMPTLTAPIDVSQVIN
ncbi:uncharacterized protein C3orf38 homolog [Acanthaster planci]|uniref:Uncharacterized protein C3orf38 homolog n=1 Tax=Acanthaster planci TaxID=133434 RepID=A0A8B8A525_ACAPL|nr:uncharacterized protein C3orf38 homolog [Acanthaster planci]